MWCCFHARAAAGVFSRLARWYRWRYRWLGLERSQRHLVAGLAGIGYRGASLLEIGCGVGWLHQWLLRHGAGTAVGVDLSPEMVAQAHRLARQQGLAQRVRYQVGDFLDLAPAIEPADIVILDKVICCYPDAEALLAKAAAKSRRALALVYPRTHPFSRALHALFNACLAGIGSDFRTWLHDPADVARWLSECGMGLAYRAFTGLWRVEIFTRIKTAAAERGRMAS